MQNTTFVWLSINLMWNLSYKVFAKKIQNLLGLLFSPKLTHPSTCIVHAEYHYCVTVYRFDVNLSYKVFTTLTRAGFTLFFPEIILIKLLTHPSTCYSHAPYHYCVTVYRSDVQCEKQSDYNLDTYGFLIFSPNSFAFIKYNITELKIRLFKMMYLHAWFRAKLISWALFFSPNNEII